jgi:hemolysin activation/secretion protein
LNRNRLLAALQLLQLDPLIEQISAELQAGARPDRSLLAVRVQEADTFTAGVFADNGRSPSVGQFRRGASLTQANLLGIGDRIELVYTNTDGSNTGDLIYRVPLNPHNGTLQFAFSITDTRVIEEPFDRIDITGNSRIYELTYRQPVLQKPDREWAIGLTAARAESETALLDQPFPLSPGADEQGRTRISALRFFQEFVQRNPRAVFAARSQFSIGVDWFDATRNDDAPDSRFFAWRGQAQYIRLLAPDTLLLLRTDLQFATDALLPLEQFGIGGLLSVRGYRQDALLTDNGAFASIELRVPVLRVPQVNGVLQLTPFVDAGVGWNVSEDNLAQEFDSDRGAQTLVSAGLGLLWRMGDRFSARLDYGFPLIRLDGDEDTWKQDGLYFRVEYFPF